MPLIPIALAAAAGGAVGFVTGSETKRLLTYAALGAGAYVGAKALKVI